MYCPNCSTETSSDKKFCRNCGFNLDEVRPLLARHDPAGRLDQSKGEGEQQPGTQRLGMGLIIGALAILLTSIYWAVISKLIIGKGELVTGVVFLTILTSFVAGGFLVAFSDRARKAKTGLRPSGSVLSAGAESTSKLLDESPAKMMPSVTERTTELIERSELREPEIKRFPGQRAERQ